MGKRTQGIATRFGRIPPGRRRGAQGAMTPRTDSPKISERRPGECPDSVSPNSSIHCIHHDDCQASTEWRNLAGASPRAPPPDQFPLRKHHAPEPTPNAYFPMQNRSKMWLSTSSDDTSPVISARADAASRISKARYSSVAPLFSPANALSSEACAFVSASR